MNEIITNGAEIKRRIISEITASRLSIFVAMAYFTDREIAMALIEAKNRGINVDIILSSNSQNETVKLMLKGAGINVHAFETGDSRGIMHHKFCLIDQRVSINGSYNYSLNASNNNVENIHLSDDQSLYSQLQAEFDRLKYNIDNRIAVNEANQQVGPKAEVQPSKNVIDTFYQQLYSLVYSAAQIDTAEYKQNGYKNSQDSRGSIDIFRTEYTHIKERIRTYATDEGLGSMKNTLISNISNAYQSKKLDLDAEKVEKQNAEKRNNELDIKQLNEKISLLKDEKRILESGNSSTEEKGLLQINKEIEKIRLEINSLEQSFIVRKFWTVGTIFVLIGLVIFGFYLSIFFASAVYKVFFEGNEIRALLEASLNPSVPQLVDANAIIKIFNKQGPLFGIVAALFFLIPLLLSNLSILGSENKLVNRLLFWVGLLIFDILVSSMVAVNADEIKALLMGKASDLKLWEVVKLGEFWLIFVFGMFPLTLTHFMISYIHKAFKSSQRELVDAEKNRKLEFLNKELIDLNTSKEIVNIKIKDKDDSIKEKGRMLDDLEISLNNRLTEIDNRFSEFQKQIKTLYEDFNSRIVSGRIFTDVILGTVISSYKSGFIEFLPTYYAPDEVARRVKEIEEVTEAN